MSTKAKNEAKKLIHRSKRQLQEIAKITSHSDYDDRYVDMQGNKGELGRYFVYNITLHLDASVLIYNYRVTRDRDHR